MNQPGPVELTVVLPAFNEARNLPRAVAAYCQCLPEFCSSFELILVDDASTDDTLALAREAAQRHPQVRILSNPVNLGQVGSLLRGFGIARGRWVTHNGMDLPFEPAETRKILEGLRAGADLVVVQRTNRKAYGIIRKVVSWCNIALIQLLFRSPIIDHNFVQGYRRGLLEACPVQSTGVSTMPIEIILKARALGANIQSFEATYHLRRQGRSAVTWPMVAKTTAELFRLKSILRRWQPALDSLSSLPSRRRAS